MLIFFTKEVLLMKKIFLVIFIAIFLLIILYFVGMSIFWNQP